MVQRLRAGSVLAEDLRTIPSTHVGQLTADCDSSYRGI